jgi:hypothetical protein
LKSRGTISHKRLRGARNVAARQPTEMVGPGQGSEWLKLVVLELVEL